MSIKNTESSFEPYIFSIKEQLELHIDSLNELSEKCLKSFLSFSEKSAVERSLQVIVEAAIGSSKHFLKLKGKPVPSEARASIERVYEILAIANPQIEEMRGAVGMRNAIIHDYLNLDWQKLDVILKNKKYLSVKNYTDCVLANLVK